MDKEQLIQDYFANRLSKADQLKVKQLLNTDLDFKSEFEDYRDISKAYKIYEAKNLKTQLERLESTSSSASDSKFKKNKLIYIAIAAGLIIGFFFQVYNGQSGDKLFKSQFDVYPNTYQPITRSNEATPAIVAFQAYENGDFIVAENEFQDILKTSSNPNIQFYYGMSLINQSKFDLALEQLIQLNKSERDFKAESLWYIALIYIQKEDYKKATQSLETLNTLNSTFKSEERKVLLQKLKD